MGRGVEEEIKRLEEKKKRIRERERMIKGMEKEKQKRGMVAIGKLAYQAGISHLDDDVLLGTF